jgi:putative SOS response-associated peptidase YedK
MCGRFTLTRPPQDIADAFGLDGAPALEPRYNVAPTQQVFAVRGGASQAREGAWLRWGLVPSWAADLSIGNKLLNARAETAGEKPAFRNAFHRRRCLIPADGFYEWQAVAGQKRPLYFRLEGGRLFAFAGLWERWQPPAGGPAVETCTILTTGANDLLRPFHERMPVILDPGRHDGWLDPRAGAETLRSWLVAWPAEEMTVTPASVRVNNPRNEGPACLAPA